MHLEQQWLSPAFEPYYAWRRRRARERREAEARRKADPAYQRKKFAREEKRRLRSITRTASCPKCFRFHHEDRTSIRFNHDTCDCGAPLQWSKWSDER
jgi:hypothetical protein